MRVQCSQLVTRIAGSGDTGRGRDATTRQRRRASERGELGRLRRLPGRELPTTITRRGSDTRQSDVLASGHW
jgi:hypothetical protein